VHLSRWPLFHSFVIPSSSTRFRRGRHPRAAASFTLGRRAGHQAGRAVTFFGRCAPMYWAPGGATDTADVKAIAGNLRNRRLGRAQRCPVEIHDKSARLRRRNPRSSACRRNEPDQPRSTNPRPPFETLRSASRSGAYASTCGTGLAESHGEAGDIAIRGHNFHKGYWTDRKQRTGHRLNAVFRTGYIATRDEDCLLTFVVDRAKDMIVPRRFQTCTLANLKRSSRGGG